MNIAIGCDHAAVEQKAGLMAHLKGRGHEVTDCGTLDIDSVDYPDFASAVVQRVQSGQAALGVLLCGTGIGMTMAANKAKGIRAALLPDPFSARMAREHNNANVICFGARVVGPELMRASLDAFLDAKFEGGKHERRVSKIMEMERRGC